MHTAVDRSYKIQPYAATANKQLPFNPSQVRGQPWETCFEARRAPWEEQSTGRPTFS